MYIDFDEIKDKIKDTAGLVADATKDLAVKAADKAKCTARMAKLSLQINSEKDSIKKAYLEIGKLYYEMHRDDADGFFTQLCDEITVANANIESIEQEIADLKAGISGDDFEVEFTQCGEDDPAEDCGCKTECAEQPAEDETTFCPENENKDE